MIRECVASFIFSVFPPRIVYKITLPETTIINNPIRVDVTPSKVILKQCIILNGSKRRNGTIYSYMDINFEKRRLSEREVEAIVEEIKKFPNPLNGKNFWLALKQVYIALSQNELIGVCGIRKLNNWTKLGPFVVFQKYHGQGYGRKIIETILKDYSNDNLFIGSRNPAVAKIASSLGFSEVDSIWKLPNTIKVYLLGALFETLSLYYISEFIRKKPIQEGPYRFFCEGEINSPSGR